MHYAFTEFVASAHHGGNPVPCLIQEDDAVEHLLVQHIEFAVRARVKHDHFDRDVALAQPRRDLDGDHPAETVAVEVQRFELEVTDIPVQRGHNIIDIQALVGVADSGHLRPAGQGRPQGVEDPKALFPTGFVSGEQHPARGRKPLPRAVVPERQ